MMFYNNRMSDWHVANSKKPEHIISVSFNTAIHPGTEILNRGHQNFYAEVY